MFTLGQTVLSGTHCRSITYILYTSHGVLRDKWFCTDSRSPLDIFGRIRQMGHKFTNSANSEKTGFADYWHDCFALVRRWFGVFRQQRSPVLWSVCTAVCKRLWADLQSKARLRQRDLIQKQTMDHCSSHNKHLACDTAHRPRSLTGSELPSAPRTTSHWLPDENEKPG